MKDDVGSKSIDEMNPSTKEEFVELSQLIVGKLSNFEVTVTHCEVILISTLRDCFIRLPDTKNKVESTFCKAVVNNYL